jgi:hypothetical protein
MTTTSSSTQDDPAPRRPEVPWRRPTFFDGAKVVKK